MDTAVIGQEIQNLESFSNPLYNSHFLHTWKEDEETLRAVLSTARILQLMNHGGISTRVFDTGLGFSIFRDKSTRTRYAFRAGCNMLGLMTEELSEETSQVAHGETVRETAAMISFLTEVIGIRDDMYLGEGHAYMKEVSASIQESFEAGVIPQRTSVINLQCDLDHPTQSLADLRHFCEVFGGLEALKGRKIAMTWAYSPSYGKPLSVPQGIVSLMSRFGMNVVLAHPEGYDLVDEPLDAARRCATQSGGSFAVVHSMEEAFRDADIVYPKSWAPMTVMKRRTELLRSGRKSELANLEKEALARNERHRDWECTEELMKLTKEGQALYAHCLPADITDVSCKHGEVAASVFERYRIDTYREAGHKPFVIAAMVLLTRFADPAALLGRLLEERRPRRMVEGATLAR